MKYINYNSLSITECCDMLNIDRLSINRLDYKTSIASLVKPDADSLARERLLYLLEEDRKAYQKCITKENLDTYINNYSDGLFINSARERVTEMIATEGKELFPLDGHSTFWGRFKDNFRKRHPITNIVMVLFSILSVVYFLTLTWNMLSITFSYGGVPFFYFFHDGLISLLCIIVFIGNIYLFTNNRKGFWIISLLGFIVLLPLLFDYFEYYFYSYEVPFLLLVLFYYLVLRIKYHGISSWNLMKKSESSKERKYVHDKSSIDGHSTFWGRFKDNFRKRHPITNIVMVLFSILSVVFFIALTWNMLSNTFGYGGEPFYYFYHDGLISLLCIIVFIGNIYLFTNNRKGFWIISLLGFIVLLPLLFYYFEYYFYLYEVPFLLLILFYYLVLRIKYHGISSWNLMKKSKSSKERKYVPETSSIDGHSTFWGRFKDNFRKRHPITNIVMVLFSISSVVFFIVFTWDLFIVYSNVLVLFSYSFHSLIIFLCIIVFIGNIYLINNNRKGFWIILLLVFFEFFPALFFGFERTVFFVFFFLVSHVVYYWVLKIKSNGISSWSIMKNNTSPLLRKSVLALWGVFVLFIIVVPFILAISLGFNNNLYSNGVLIFEAKWGTDKASSCLMLANKMDKKEDVDVNSDDVEEWYKKAIREVDASDSYYFSKSHIYSDYADFLIKKKAYKSAYILYKKMADKNIGVFNESDLSEFVSNYGSYEE